MLHPWYAFDIDCPHLKNDFGLPQNAKTTGGKGFLVIQSDRTLDVVAIYTQLAKRATGVGSSMEVEYIEPKMSIVTRGPDLTVEVYLPTTESGCTTGTGDCTLRVHYKITNLGDVDMFQPYEVEFYLSNNTSRTITLPASFGFAAGQTRTLITPLPGQNKCFTPNCTTKVTLDPNGLIAELDETNNSDQRTDTP